MLTKTRTGLKNRPKRRKQTGKFNPETCQKIVDSIRAGNYNTTAAKAAGISERTFYEWVKKGENQRAGGRYANFVQALRAAEAAAEEDAVLEVRSHGKKVPQASQWFLERKHPERWGRKDRLDIKQESTNIEVSDELRMIKEDPELNEKLSRLYREALERARDAKSPKSDD